MRRRILFYVAVAFVAKVAAAQPPGGSPASSPASTARASAQLDDQQKAQANAVLQRACSSCHGIDLTTGQPRSRDEWTDVVSRMVGMGAQLNDDEYNILIEYLATQYGSSHAKASVKQSGRD